MLWFMYLPMWKVSACSQIPPLIIHLEHCLGRVNFKKMKLHGRELTMVKSWEDNQSEQSMIEEVA